MLTYLTFFNETWDDKNYEDDAIEEDIEITRKTKVSTNPK